MQKKPETQTEAGMKFENWNLEIFYYA